ncbi:hypothetical protein JL721_7840 [Aureococcus anophagefferens]|nr:hypothetical protein JL721_7840 [Aureococcus anophagefferens]
MVIVGYGMDLPSTNSVEDVAKKQADTLKFLFDLGKIMVADPDLVKKLAVLTSDVFSDAKQLHDEYGLGVVTNATFEGFLNCLRVELETLPILHLDLDWYLDDAMMEHVALELFRPGLFGANQVRLGAKGRYCARLMSHHKYAVAPQKDQPWLDETTKFESYLKPHLYTEGVVALSGGNGALAMVMTLFLIEKMGASKSSATTKFLFLSRSAKIPAEQESMWKNVQAAIAGTAMVAEQIKCDVSKPELVEAFSNYAAANSFLNGLARHRVALGKPCCSIMWGGWGEAGMAANLPASVKKRYADGPLPLFSNREALQGLDESLATGLSTLGVWKFNPEALKAMNEMDDDASASLYMRTYYSRISPLECYYFSYPYGWMDEYTACVDFQRIQEDRDEVEQHLVEPHFKYTGLPFLDKDPETLDSPGPSYVGPQAAAEIRAEYLASNVVNDGLAW